MFFKKLLLERHLSPVQAGLYAMLAYFLFTVSDGIAKYLMGEGYARSVVLLISNMPSLVLLSVFMIYRHGVTQAFHTIHKKYHLIRGMALIGVTFFGFMGLQYLPLSDFYGIVFSGPLVLTIGAYLFFGERIKPIEWAVIIIGFAGTLVVSNPSLESGFNIGYIYAFLGVICMTSAGLAVRKIGSAEDPYLYVIFSNLAIVLANLVPAIQSGLPDTITTAHLLTMALYSFTIPAAVLVLSAVFARAPTIGAVAPFQYTQIIWGSLFGFIVFGDIPQMNTIIGSGIVVACGLYIIFYHKRKKGKRTILETQ